MVAVSLWWIPDASDWAAWCSTSTRRRGADPPGSEPCAVFPAGDDRGVIPSRLTLDGIAVGLVWLLVKSRRDDCPPGY